MGRRDYNDAGFDVDLFDDKPTRRKKPGTTLAPISRDEALKISQGLGFMEPPRNPPLQPSSVDNDYNWENIIDTPHINDDIRPDSSGDQYATHQKSLRRAEAQARLQSKWKAVETKLTATYLHLQQHTRNWTKADSYLGSRTKRRLTFCECVPDVIRLLHLGYIAGSPQHPRTAFTVRLVQFQHHLWNYTVISTSGFIDALMAFLDNQCHSRLSPQQLKGKYKKNLNCSLRRPFTQTIDIYRQILYHQQKLYEEGLQLSALDISAARCAQCFGPAEAEPTTSRVNEGCGLWLQKRYRNAVDVLMQAQSALTTLFGMANPNQPGETYTAAFFRGQWTLEREAYESKLVVMQQQKLELGRLLSLQDELIAEWSKPVLTAEQTIIRLRTTAELEEKIAKQVKKVGTADVPVCDKEKEAFLKLWYSKHEVGLKYVAICEEKRPLQQSRSDGHSSNLGHKGQTNLLLAVRRHATKLKKLVDTYRTRRAQYHAEYPDRMGCNRLHMLTEQKKSSGVSAGKFAELCDGQQLLTLVYTTRSFL
ncbi:uncharacterized protein MELLADRAFT_108932 [Melampsora larici-populina 98AG31]|uniref:CxC1-like cysteine cluster associated with KDZ transposases domain-containing protein n=1 Tax=Melampsora larici-populina (strain 98AG31 / pathotype 3-4-7) TaxID=747676 RepID=F4RUS6_MELLP|nr:uncharacterized protein MELLADRAFT_108932 [Melampsora larici-populina 98AG31]EGG03746.1 hypothetical protein MELLADRAFT_108932 [Melampsora larici-populina 98AG31]